MRLTGLVLAAALLLPQGAWADNAMGYRLMSQQQAETLPHSGGTLGLDIRRGQVVTDAGMTFEVLSVSGVRPGSAGAQAGLRQGDQIVAVDGMVFASLRSFAGYIGSLPPGRQITVDYLPSGGGPQQAQRVTATLGSGNKVAPAARPGLSTGQKVAIGVAAVALFGCYERGCFSRSQAPAR